MQISYVFNSIASNLSRIAGANYRTAQAHADDSEDRYEQNFHTSTRSVTTYLLRLALKSIREGDIESAEVSASKVSHELIHNHYSFGPTFEIKHVYDNDKVAFNILEGFAQMVECLQKLEEDQNQINIVNKLLWHEIANVYQEIAYTLSDIYEDSFYKAKNQIKTATKLFNEFITRSDVKELLTIHVHNRNWEKIEPPTYTLVESNPF